ncbi:MAG: DUF4058 family protein [Chloroflexi bacterium]|nr:DUF4058 family protein [Chloroflexota bacterium]
MPSPFPGMDPYLEHPEDWIDVHNRLIVAIADAIAPRVRPKYRVVIEKRTYRADPRETEFAGRPDVAVLRERTVEYVAVESRAPIPVTLPIADEIEQGYLQVRNVATGKVITVIEILSPTNKRPGKGRREYTRKRAGVLDSDTHFVEIDLLRDGDPLSVSDQARADYRILVSRAELRPRADLYAFSVREPIPVFPLPLEFGDEEPRVNLQTLLHDLYDRAGYDLAINYRADAMPPLSVDDAVWADALLRAKNLR